MRHGGVPQNIRLMGCRVRLPVGIAVCQIASTVCQMRGCSFGGVVPPSLQSGCNHSTAYVDQWKG